MFRRSIDDDKGSHGHGWTWRTAWESIILAKNVIPNRSKQNYSRIAAMTAPDSPRSSQSPPPTGAQGDLELELLGLANALYNLGTTVINDSTKEKDKPGGGKQVGLRVCVSLLSRHPMSLPTSSKSTEMR
jgi:hypothetical protein